MLGAIPHTLDVDVLRQVPDLVGGVDRVVVLGVHDAGVVEDDVNTAPFIGGGDGGGYGCFVGDVAFDGLDFAGVGGNDGGEFGEGGVQCLAGDVGEDDGGAFTEEEDCGFQADTAGGAGDDLREVLVDVVWEVLAWAEGVAVDLMTVVVVGLTCDLATKTARTSHFILC